MAFFNICVIFYYIQSNSTSSAFSSDLCNFFMLLSLSFFIFQIFQIFSKKVLTAYNFFSLHYNFVQLTTRFYFYDFVDIECVQEQRLNKGDYHVEKIENTLWTD